MSTALIVDGIEYPGVHIVSLKRNFQVLDGENAGRNMTGGMIRDIVGTYYNYSVELDTDAASADEYNTFYEVITAPQDSHEITVPYGAELMVFDAYVSSGSDELISRYDGVNRWGGLAFNFIAMEPQRRPA